ncbi:MAG: GntR family transcriptional regulator [Clostridiales bacterium]|nr:GntR family transcriptional regulator [Clostridiales bacterium]
MTTNPVLLSKLSLDSDIPLYSQLVSIIRRNIAAGTLAAGDVLPSESELCRTFDISRSTVRQAIGALETDGLVVRKQGRGTFVAEPKVRRRAELIYSFTAEMSALGLEPSSRLMEYEVMRPTPDIVRMLELSSDEVPVYRFARIRSVNGEPLALETSFYPTYIYPNLTRELCQTHSFYSLLYDVGITPCSTDDSYEAVMLGRKEAELLACRPYTCAFSMQRRTRNEAGTVFEYTQSLIRADRVRLDVQLHRDGVSFTRSIDQGSKAEVKPEAEHAPVEPEPTPHSDR